MALAIKSRPLTGAIRWRHDLVVSAERDTNRDECGSQTRTLGDLLYADKAKVRASEKDWVGLVQAVAAGDQLALHSLYEQTYRIVFTLIVRIINNRETAEELTLDVFHNVWRRASTYDPAGGSVVGWIMNQARSRAIDRLRFEQRKKRVNNYRTVHLLRLHRMTRNRPATSRSRTASCVMPWRSSGRKSERRSKPHFFAELTYDEVAAKLNQPLGTIKARIRSGLGKLRQTLGRTLKGI